jgi:MoxR-like ATPase
MRKGYLTYEGKQMPKPRNINLDEINARVRRSYQRRGYKIVPGQQPQKQAAVKHVVPQPAKLEPANPIIIPTTTPIFAPNFSSSSISPLQKLHTLYNAFEEQGLYLSPSLDMTLSYDKEANIDVGGTQKTKLGGESYNALKLFPILISIVGSGKMLIEGPPGSGKTSTSCFAASGLFNLLIDYIKRCTIQGHPEQTEEKMIAMYDPIEMIKGNRKLILREWLGSKVKIIDEINRLRPESLSIIYEMIQSGTVTYQGQLIKVPPGPFFATKNFADDGNFRIPPPVKDRFDIAVIASTMNAYCAEDFVRKRAGTIRRNLEKVVMDNPLSDQDFARIRMELAGIEFPPEVASRLAHFLSELQGCDMAGVNVENKNKGSLSEKKPPGLCTDCSHYSQENAICSKTENDLGSRSIDSIYTYSKALAYWRGNSKVTEEDVRVIVPYATWFKVSPTRAAFELNPRFVNDRIALMAHLYEMSSRTYEEVVNAMPEYKDVAATIAGDTNTAVSGLDRTGVEALITKAGQLDTPAKYPLITALKKMYAERK